MEESEIQNFIHSGGKMANIERLSQDMQSNNPKKRLDAYNTFSYDDPFPIECCLTLKSRMFENPVTF